MTSVNHPTASRPCIARHLPDFKFATFLSLMAAAGQSSRIVVVTDADTRSISDELLDCISSITRAKDTIKSTLHPLPNFKFLVLRTGSVKDHIKRLRQLFLQGLLTTKCPVQNRTDFSVSSTQNLQGRIRHLSKRTRWLSYVRCAISRLEIQSVASPPRPLHFGL